MGRSLNATVPLAALLAGQAVIAVTAALRHYDEVGLFDHLRSGLSSPSVIDQASGIVMAHQRGTAERAFRRAAHHFATPQL